MGHPGHDAHVPLLHHVLPLGVYPRWLQLFAESSPLYQGIEIVRGLMLGTVAPELLGRAAYLAILGAVGLAVSSRRLGRLLTS
jgi:lipooligosaccharide transport system permease protein